MKLLCIMELLITIWNINTYKYEFFLKCRKDTEKINSKVSKQVMVEQCYYQIV